MNELEVRLAAAQAREAALRRALERVRPTRRCGCLAATCDPRDDYDVCAAALAQPSDDAALRALLLQVAGAVWATAAPSVEMDATACAAIVARVLGDGAGTEGGA